MPSEREMRTHQESILFDIIRLMQADDESLRKMLLRNMFERAKSGMTAEEIDAVRERVRNASEDDKK
jgi:hypothetical protein